MASVVVVMNDLLGRMEEDPTAGKQIADAIRSIYRDGKFRYGEAICYGHVSGHDVVVRSEYGGRCIDQADPLPAIVLHMLKSALERHGYRVTKMRQKAKKLA